MPSDFKVSKSFVWCTELPSKDQPQESSTFVLKGNEFFFQLIFEQSGNTWYCEFYLKLKNKYAELEPYKVPFQIGFKNEETLSLKKGEFKIAEKREFWYITVASLQSKLPEDYMLGNCIKLIFQFDDIDESEFKIHKELDDKSMQTSTYADPHLMLESLLTDFSKLLDEGLNHDVEFICKDGKVKAHKDILCCRSAVFTSMLQSDMVEGKTGQVNIEDMNITIFQQFLRFLYTGILPELTVSVALQFYEVGDKYDVGSLKKFCADYLIAHLSPENACDILIVADRHSDSDFKTSIIGYTMEIKMPLKGEIWPEFCKENPLLAIEVLNLFCQHIQSK